jgi:hypothetical protein
MPRVRRWRVPRLAVAVLAVPAAPFFLADYLLAVARFTWWRIASREVRQQETFRAMVVGVFYIVLYRWLPTPRIPLSGLPPTIDILYDGRLVDSMCRWWDEFLRRRPRFRSLDGVTETAEVARRKLQRSINPENRELLVALARNTAPFPELAEAAMALGYVSARVLARGTGSDYLRKRQLITLETFVENQQRYSFIHGSNYLDGPKSGWWADLEAGYWNRFIIAAMRWSYSDQVKRWERALGTEMGGRGRFRAARRGRAAAIQQKFADLLLEYGARVYETEEVELLEADRGLERDPLPLHF